jgi:hypothetical protein
MAKLTRTQKFADLRDSLANDKEPSLSTKDLSVYEDRLTNLTGERLEKQEQESVRKVLDDDPKYIWTAFEENDDAYDPYSYSKQNDDFFNNRYVWDSLQEFPESSSHSYETENTFNIDELPDINDDRQTEEDLTQVHTFEPIIEDNTMESPVIEQVHEEEEKFEAPREVEEEIVEEASETYSEPVVEESFDNNEVSNLYEEAQLETEPISTEEFLEQQEARYKELSNTNPEIEAAYAEAEKHIEEVTEAAEENIAELNEETSVAAQEVEEEVEHVHKDVQEEVNEILKGVAEHEAKQADVEDESEKIDRIDTEAEKLAAMQFLNDIVSEKEEVVEETIQEQEPVSENITEEVNETETKEEDLVETHELVEETAEEVIKEDNAPEEVVVEEEADNHAPEDIDHSYDSSLIQETINEVGEYNRSVGEETITTLTNNLVHSVRHPGATRSEKHHFSEVPVSDTNTKNDEEFSNTVSLEITKIMDEISNNEDVQEVPEVVNEPVEQHPVLTKALEDEAEEDVVEIKNIKELEAEEATSSTISNTIPFVVAAGEEDLIEVDEEDDSNTILNIILIVLIVILVAVLGLIIFYILRTRGII